MTSPYIEVVVDGRRIFQHRAVMERKVGRRLKRCEIVHHKNEDGHDNSPKNLKIVTQLEHAAEHMRGSTKEIIRLSDLGFTNRQISDRVGIELRNVWRTLNCRGLKAKTRSTRPLTWDVKKAFKMLKEKSSMREIGRQLGVSHNSISAGLKSAGFILS